MPFTFTVHSDRGPLYANYNDLPLVKKIAGSQYGLYDVTDQQFKDVTEQYHRGQWHQRWGQGMFQGLPDNAVCTEIGAGAAMNAILTSQYLRKSTWNLIDGDFEGLRDNPTWTEEGDLYYNAWECALDGITATRMNPARFTINNLNALPWPQSDLIISQCSWCFHYPTEVYLDQVMASLRPGGTLYVTIRVNDKDDSRRKISEALGCEPINQITYDQWERTPHLQKLSQWDVWRTDCLWRRPL